MYNEKIKTKLNENIDLKPFVHPDANVVNTNYQLFSTCTHMGSNRGGHYIAYTKHKGNWYLKDDISCNKIDSINLLDFHYIIMYKRVG